MEPLERTGMTPYLAALAEAMSLIGPTGLILGQSVLAGGTAIRETLAHLPDAQLLELPVFEETQLGMSIGLSLAGVHPVVSVFPRWNFLLLAANQLVNHLDKLPEYGAGYRPRVIIRVAVGSDEPLDPGPQHLGNHSAAFRAMLRNIPVVELWKADEIVPAYRAAIERDGSTVLVEFAERYDR
jgi:pyruvate/2-oxoglutarate/acetoin dehydrogenase E1 component